MNRAVPCIRWFLLLVSLVSGLAAEVQAALPVTMEIIPMSIRGRSGGGIPVQIKLEHNSTGQLLEGDLFLKIYHGVPASNRTVSEDELIATLRYEGIVLQGTDYFFQTTLPPLEHAFQGQYDIQAWFETESQSIPLTTDPKQLDPPEPHELLSIGRQERATLLCSCSGEVDYQRASENRRFLNETLSLENYDPFRKLTQNTQRQTVGQESRQVNYFAASYDARDLSEDPLLLCSFDVVLLADGALGRLEPLQMSALTTWVEAGGSLCVFPDDIRLDGSHLRFLEYLTGTTGDVETHLTLNDDGRLLFISEQEAPILMNRVGLGRMVLLPNVEDLSKRLSSEEQGQLVAFLWKLRSDSQVWEGKDWAEFDLESVLKEQGFEIAKDQRGFYVKSRDGAQDYYGQRYADREALAMDHRVAGELHPMGNKLIEACWDVLMPSGVEMVPTWVIAIILVAYVLTIGPVDYFVLGMFGKRKLTWILFPAVTVVYTLLTVFIANRYMASTETGSSLTVVDVIDGGRPIRVNNMKMHFFGTRRTVDESRDNEILVPAALGETYANFDPGMNTRMQRGSDLGRKSTVIRYSGRFPQSYSISQTLQQWSPKVQRSLSFSVDAQSIPNLPWDDASLLTTSDGRNRLRSLIRNENQSSDDIVGAVVLNGQQQYSLGIGENMFDSHYVRSGMSYLSSANQQYYYYAGYPDRKAMLSAGLIKSTWSPAERFFRVVSQVSPQGSATGEDLPIMDVSDPGQWALIIVRRKDEGYEAYRKVYFTEQSQLTKRISSNTNPDESESESR